MKLFVNVSEMRVCDVRIHLCSGDVAMAQHGLDAAYVGTIHKQICRKTVSQCVRTDVFGDARQERIVCHHALDAPCCESPIVAACTGCVLAAIADKKGR